MPETAVVVDIQDGRFNNFSDNVIKLSDDETKWTGLLASENNRGMFSGPEKLPGLNGPRPTFVAGELGIRCCFLGNLHEKSEVLVT